VIEGGGRLSLGPVSAVLVVRVDLIDVDLSLEEALADLLAELVDAL
jgi:hypothetical protein